MQWGKTNEVQRKFEKVKQSKHEININLPLARARHLKSDVHDSSSIMRRKFAPPAEASMLARDVVVSPL